MYLIRRSTMEDVPTLLKLARMVYFINLPPDRDVISQKVIHSRNCFLRVSGSKREPAQVPSDTGAPPGVSGGYANKGTDLFMFTIEDATSRTCLGTSQLIARMGGPGNPNTSLKLEKREKFSTVLQTGTSHMVARLHLDESGPTEIGGLILQPSARGHRHRLGQFLSFVRFHFIGLHRPLFADRVLAEMMARISPDGVSMLWEYLGRRFVPLSYTEADRFCQFSREFIVSLFPHEDIYLSLLPPEARSVVAEVGPETVPARRMLEKLGFSHKGFIDPFDGGPYLDAVTDEITIVRQTRWAVFAGTARAADCREPALVSSMDADGEFRAVLSGARCSGDEVRLPRDAVRALNLEPGERLGITVSEHFAPRSPSKPRASGVSPARQTRGRRTP
ncbi:MAG: arginine N-succinyltransferase [Phycisphaeraceae bacterium]|nr:arginine N-succinyltransferase [Phycisphaeraceae bacterium]